jgi:hypothetical protein
LKLLCLSVLSLTIATTTVITTLCAQQAAKKKVAVATGLTNDDIIGLASAGLSDDVIIAKIQKAPSTSFDTSVAGLKSLKAGGVSSAVIKVMLDPTAPVAPPPTITAAAPAQMVVGSSVSATEPEYVGIVFYLDSTGKLIPLEKQPLNTEYKTKYMGFGGAQSSTIFKGVKSETRFKVGQPLQLVVRLNTTGGIDPSSLVNIDVLKVAKDERLIVSMKVGTMGIGGVKSHNGETQRALTFSKYGEQSFLISPASPLDPGEYVVTTGDAHTAYLFGIDPQ